MVQLVQRPGGLAWLRQWRDHDLIKVVTGVRRCGKSTLLELFADDLRESGVPPQAIQRINLEDFRFRDLLTSPDQLYDHVVGNLQEQAMNYVFIDEVQQVPEFQRVLDGLFVRPDVDLYVTGSNAQLLSGDLATLLTGRYVQYPLLPLGFQEFWTASPDTNRQECFSRYLACGGMPYTLRLPDQEAIMTYLDGIVATALMRDVLSHKQIRDTLAFQDVVGYVADNIGNLVSVKHIADTLTSAGRRITSVAVENYLDGLADAHLVYPVPRYDLRGKRRLARIEKYYLVDMGIRTSLLQGQFRDEGRVLENVVYLELLRRGYQVWVGSLPTTEIDFVARQGGLTMYIQVALTVRDEQTLARELEPLRSAPGHHQRILLTLDPEPLINHDGIAQRNVLDWLLSA